MMRRRDFIVGLGGAVLGFHAAHATGTTPRIGVLTLAGYLDPGAPPEAAFVAALNDLGDVVGKTIEIDYRDANGDVARLKPLAADLLTLKPSVVLGGQPSAARAMKALAPDLPIVCPTLEDNTPDLFTSFAHPDHGVTGIATVVEGMNAKLVEFAAELVPGTKRLSILDNPTTAGNNATLAALEKAATARGMKVSIEKASNAGEIGPAFDRLAKDGQQPVIVPINAMFVNNVEMIAERSRTLRLPTISQNPLFVSSGGLLSYSIDLVPNLRRAAYFVDRILKGAKPADLPIEFPTKLVLAINLKTAKAIGVTVPPYLIATADQVIE